MNLSNVLWAIKCNDKFVYFYEEDYLHGEISLVDFNILYSELFYISEDIANKKLKYISDNFEKVVKEDIDVFDLMTMEVVKLHIWYKIV